MTTENRNNRRASLFIFLIFLLILMYACNFPLFSENTKTSNPSESGKTSIPAIPENTQKESGSVNSLDCLNRIQSGKTTRNEVISILGEPVGKDNNNGVEAFFYNSALPGQFNSIVLSNDTVTMVSVILAGNDLQEWSAVHDHYGEPAQTTYSNYLMGTRAYIYSDKGLTFVADPSINVVYIKQCFVPMSIEDYMRTWGASLPTEDPYNL